MNVYEAQTLRPLGECQLPLPAGRFMVYRGLDEQGEYRRVKLEVVETPQGVGMAVEAELAHTLPGFIPVAGLAAPTPHTVPELHGVMGMNLLLPQDEAPPLLTAQVAVRLLLLLERTPWHSAQEITLSAGETVACMLPLPALPEGNLFLLPDPALPLAMDTLLGRVALHAHDGKSLLVFQSATPLTLPTGTLLGTVESRSASEFPEGMREKVFLGHLMAKVQALMGGAA